MRDMEVIESSSSSSQQATNHTPGAVSKKKVSPYQPSTSTSKNNPYETPNKTRSSNTKAPSTISNIIGAPGSLIGDISTLRNRLRELDSHNDNGKHRQQHSFSTPQANNNNNIDNGASAVRPRSQSALFDRRQRSASPSTRFASMGAESALVNQLRKEIAKVNNEKAEMELTLMNQMSNLAYENQNTMDGLRARLEESENLVESLQQPQQPGSSSSNNSSSNLFEVQRLKKSLQEERKMRHALEEERDARHGELEKVKEERDACAQENFSIKEELSNMKQQVSDLRTSNANLSNQLLAAHGAEQSATQTAQNLQSQLADIQSRHKGQLSEMKESYQRRYNQLESDVANKYSKRQQSGVGNLHNKIGGLEEENANLSEQVLQLRDQLAQEQTMNSDLEQSLQEQTDNNSQIWDELEDSKKRCNQLEEEVAQLKTAQEQNKSNDGNQSDLKGENEMLSNQIAAIHEQCVGEQEKCAKLKASLETERATNNKLRLSLRQHQQRYEELNRNLHRNNSGMGLVNGKVVALEKEKKTLSNQILQLKEQLSQAQTKTRELESSVAEHQNIIEDQIHRKNSSEGRRQSDVAALESAQLELQSVMNSYQSDVANLEQKVRLSEQQLTERNRQVQRLEVEINEERRIRKSLTAQLTQLKMANDTKSNETQVNNAARGTNDQVETIGKQQKDASMVAELQRLRKENTKLNDELKVRAIAGSTLDPAELEFLRKQNKMLGERANGLHAEQMKELQNLREKTKSLNEELSALKEVASATDSAPGRSNSPALPHQKDLMAEVQQLRKENAALIAELNSLSQCLDSLNSGKEVSDNTNNQQARRRRESSTPPASPRRSVGGSRDGTPREHPSPRSRSVPPNSGMQTPPLSPPPMRNTKKSSTPGSPRTPVRGIVESFERRISRTNSSGSLAAAAEEAHAQLQGEASKALTSSNSKPILPMPCSPSRKSPANQSQGAGRSEVDDIRRELHQERAAVQELQEKYTKEAELNHHLQNELEEKESKHSQVEQSLQQLQGKFNAEMEQVQKLRMDLSRMQHSESKRAQTEQSLQDREGEIQRLQTKISELQKFEQRDSNRAQVEQSLQELQGKYRAEIDRVQNLRLELSRMEHSEVKRKEAELAVQDREVRIQRLQAKISELEDIALEVGDLQQGMEKEKATVQDLQIRLTDESKVVATLRGELSKMEEKEALRLQLEKKCHESEGEIQKLRSKVGALETMLANAQSLASQDAESEIEKLRGEVAQADAARQGFEHKLFEERAEMENLQADLVLAAQKITQSQAHIDSLKEQVASSKESQEALERYRREDESIIERLQNELGASRMALEHSLDELECLKSRSNNSSQRDQESMQRDKDEIQRLRSELMVAKEALDINVEEMEKLEKCVKDADASRMISARQNLYTQQEQEKEIEKLKVELGKESDKNKGQGEEIERLHSQVASLQHELADAYTNVEDLKAIISKLQTAHDSELHHAQNSGKRNTRSIGAEVNTLKVELTKNQISKGEMQMGYMNKIHELEVKIDSMQAEMDDELQDKIKEMNQMQLTLTQKEDEIRQLQKEREQICSSVNNISSTRKEDIDELQEELMNLTAKTGDQAREIHSLKMQVEEFELRKEETDGLNERIEELEDELRRVPRSRTELSQTDAEIFKKENKMLRESLRELGVERRDLQEKLEVHLKEKTSSRSTQVLRERNAALKKEVERLTKRLKKMEHSMTRFTI